MPDTDNLLRLAEYYEVSLDELTARSSPREAARGELSPSAEGVRGGQFIATVLTLLAVAAYFLWVAQPLLLSTMDDVTEVFGLVPGPALAVAWFIAEVVFLSAPFLVMSVVPSRLPRWSVALPLIVLAALALPPSLASLIGGAQFVEYSGIGGALKTSVVMKADALAVLLACAALAWSQRHRRFRTASASS